MNLSGVSGAFTVQWYDPRNGGGLQDGSVTTVTGGGSRSLGNPPNESSKDWAILIRSETGVGVGSGPVIIPSEFKLYPAYPNPFNPETQINFSVPEPTKINITVFDINGRMIKTLLNQSVNAGEYSITWDASGLASGLYFIKLSSANFSAITKCTLMK